MNKQKPELLAPAGSFMSAYYAFEAGADGVYLGVKDFSARKSAQNFNQSELSKLKQLSIAKNKKIYIALNTIVAESEIEKILTVLSECHKLSIDGLIIQDFGVLDLVRAHFPGIPVHASTQMAIHNDPGVKKAAELGITRVILPRELSFDDVKNLKCRFPNMELEVFIHGALCYSYSGLCLASGLMAGRSGNRGECAQVCRLPFVHKGKEGRFLSCCDLFTGKNIHRLIASGIDSFKIEGRLKPPEYVYNTVRLYRYIIDNPLCEDTEEYEKLLARSEFVFAREKTSGYLFGGKNENIITSRYSRSVGHLVGRVEEKSDDSFSFLTESDISIDDVLQFFLNPSETVPYKLPVRKLFVHEILVEKAANGDYVTVRSGKVPDPGQEIFKVYAKELELPGIQHKDFKPFKQKVIVDITVCCNAAGLIKIAGLSGGRTLEYSHPCMFEFRESRVDTIGHIRKIFEDEHDPKYEIVVKAIQFETIEFTGTFIIPHRLLRNIRAGFIAYIDELDRKHDIAALSTITETLRAIYPKSSNRNVDDISEFIRSRGNLNSKCGVLPFYTGGKIDTTSIAFSGISCFIPMKPVVGNDDNEYYREISDFILNNSDLEIFLGINNLHHLKIVEQAINQPNVYSFIDFFFYLANSAAIRFVIKELPNVSFGYFWIEGNEDYESLSHVSGFPLFKIDNSFKPPYFLHTGSFCKESFPLDYKTQEKVFDFNWKDFHFKAMEDQGLTCIFPK